MVGAKVIGRLSINVGNMEGQRGFVSRLHVGVRNPGQFTGLSSSVSSRSLNYILPLISMASESKRLTINSEIAFLLFVHALVVII